MKHIPARILLHECLNSHLRPEPNERSKQQRAYILDAAMRMFAANGRAGVTMRNLADALDLSRDTLRRHILDMHHLFALVLAAHLTMLTRAIEHIDPEQPDIIARRRQALLHMTTDRYGYTARLHVLLDRDRYLLPDDEIGAIETQLDHLATLLGAAPAEAQEILFPASAQTPTQSIQTPEAQPAPHQTATPERATPETQAQPQPAHLQPAPAPRPAWPAPTLAAAQQPPPAETQAPATPHAQPDRHRHPHRRAA